MLKLEKAFSWKKRYLSGYGPAVQRRKIIPFNLYQGNDTSAYRPEVWANEAVRLLWEDMVYAGLVHRDFSPEIANFGETVHTRKPGTFVAKRKQNDLDDVDDQDVTATKIDVVLNQRVYISFVIGDGEKSKSFQDLFKIYLEPAMNGEARLLDQVIAGQVYQFLGNRAGGLGSLTSSNGHDYLMDARKVFNDSAVPSEMRWMGLSSPSETLLQKTALFKQAQQIGDQGQALRNALLGHLGGWNTFLSLNTPAVRGATQGTATTTAAAAAAGATSISSTAAIVTGAYFTIAGDMTPLRATTTAGSGPYTIGISRPLLNAVASGAVLQPYASGLINQGSAIAAGDTTLVVTDGYPKGWMKPIVVDGTGVPVVGQLVSFKAVGGTLYTPEYCIVQVLASGTQILLDRPLDNAVADNDIVDYGPNGDFNFGFRQPAVALVNRSMDIPEEGTGARANRAIFNNMSMRVVMTYDGKKQGTRVTLDSLFGIKPLDTAQGMCLLG